MTTNKENEKEPKVLTLDIPQREGREGYIGTLFGLYLKMGGIIADANFRETDVRVYTMVKFIINLIPGKKTRIEIRKNMRQEIDEAWKTCTNNEEKLRARNEICLDYIGDVQDFVDKHIGVSSENRVGFVVDTERAK